MDKKVLTEPAVGSPTNPIVLPKSKKILESYYAGKRLESPLGGYLDVLGVREGDGGKGRVLLECNTSSLRFVLTVPKATKAEKGKVKEDIEAEDDLFCPRHGSGQHLAKSGKFWVCALCGVPYGKS
jgi:ribosomal protein S27AE